MNTPRWNSSNAELVRDELLRRVGAADEAQGTSQHLAGDRWHRMRLAVAVVIVAVVIVPAAILAITLPQRPRPAGGNAPSPTSSVVGRTDALAPAAALVGLWKVQAESEGTSTWVRFTPNTVTVERDRELVYGSWISGGAQIVASAYGWSGGIENRTVTWLEDARRFVDRGSSVVLTDGAGRMLAILSPAVKAPAPKGALPELINGRTSEADVTSYFAPPAPPDRPGPTVTAGTLHGRWITGDADTDGNHPFVTFASDGTFRGSDGCNGISGRWLLSTDNQLAFTGGFHTDVACDNLVPVPAWTGAARTASVIDDRLTLYDQKGSALGSFVRG